MHGSGLEEHLEGGLGVRRDVFHFSIFQAPGSSPFAGQPVQPGCTRPNGSLPGHFSPPNNPTPKILRCPDGLHRVSYARVCHGIRA
jgi:hypothetical protein